MPEINAEGTEDISVSYASINQTIEIEKSGSAWKLFYKTVTQIS